MFNDIAIACAVLAGASCAVAVVVVLKLLLAARAWRGELENIADCAASDELEMQRVRLLTTLFRRWPETIRVSLDPEDPLIQKVRPSLRSGHMQRETLVDIYRVKPGAVQITLDPKRHKMQICDAQRLGMAVMVVRRAAGQFNPRELQPSRAGDSALLSAETSLPRPGSSDRAVGGFSPPNSVSGGPRTQQSQGR